MPNIGICFSGGIAKGAFQIGFCKALLNYIGLDDISAVSASSIGSWNAAAFLTKNIDYAEELWLDNGAERLHKTIHLLTKRLNTFNRFDLIINDDTNIDKDFFVTCCEFPAMTVDYYNIKGWEPYETRKILHAAVSIPTLMPPIKVKNKKLIDGAFRDNIPLKPLSCIDLDLIFVVHFDPFWIYHEGVQSSDKVVNLCFFLNEHIIKDSFDFRNKSISNMINTGYAKTSKLLEILFKNGADDLEYILYANKIHNTKALDTDKGLNTDRIINVMNGVSDRAERLLRRIIHS